MQNFDAVNKLIYWILTARYFGANTTIRQYIRQTTSQCLDSVFAKEIYSVRIHLTDI